MKYDCLDETCKAMVREATKDPRFSKGAFTKWYDSANVEGKRVPSAWFSTVFPKELAKGTFYEGLFIEEPKPEGRKRTVQEYMKDFDSWDEFPEPVDDEDAMNQDEATKLMWEGACKSLGAHPIFREPAKDAEEFLKDVWPIALKEELAQRPEYLENTFISVYRESRERNEPMRKTCERKGLKMEGLIW